MLSFHGNSRNDEIITPLHLIHTGLERWDEMSKFLNQIRM